MFCLFFLYLRRQLLVEHASCLLTPHLLANPVETPILRQSFTQRLQRLPRLDRKHQQLAIYILIVDRYTLSLRDVVKNHRSLHLVDCLISLRLPQPNKTPLPYVSPRHALLPPRPQSAIQSCFDLLLHKRFRNRELEPFNQFAHQLIFRSTVQRVLLAISRMLTQLGLKIIPALIVAKLFGKLRIPLRKTLMLDAFHGHVVAHALSRKPSLAEVRRVIDLKLQLLTRLRSAQRIVEGRQSILPANLNEHIFAGNRSLSRSILNAILGHRLRQILHFTAKLNLRPIPIHQSAIFLDRLNRRVAFEHTIQLRIELLGGQSNVRPAHSNAVVALKVDLGRNLKRSFKLQRLPIDQLHIPQLWLRDRAQLPLIDRLAESLRNQALQHLLANLLRKLGTDQRLRYLACAKPRDPRQFLVPLDDCLKTL